MRQIRLHLQKRRRLAILTNNRARAFLLLSPLILQITFFLSRSFLVLGQHRRTMQKLAFLRTRARVEEKKTVSVTHSFFCCRVAAAHASCLVKRRVQQKFFYVQRY